LRITGYSATYAKFERWTKLVISKLQCNAALIERNWGVSAGSVKQKSWEMSLFLPRDDNEVYSTSGAWSARQQSTVKQMQTHDVTIHSMA